MIKIKIYDLIKKRRTIRKFQNKKVPLGILKKCVNAARLIPSASNKQPLEFIIINKNLEKIYRCLKWAGYLKDFDNSKKQPQAYIVILRNNKINPNAFHDEGIAAENIVLTGFENKISSCIIGSINKEKLGGLLKIPKNFEISLVIALGYADEKSKVVDIKKGVEYYYQNKILNVPKRRLRDILHFNQYEDR